MALSSSKVYRVSLGQYAYLQTVTAGLSKANYRLFCHLFVSSISRFRQVQENGKGWIPIAKRYIQDKFRTANPVNLERHGLIDINRSYTKGKHPRRYRIRDWVLDGYVQASLEDDDTPKRLVSIVTGKPLPKRPPEPLSDSDNDTIPTLVQLAIGRFKICYFDRPAILKHLKRLRASYKETPSTQNRFRYLNDWFIFDSVDKLAQPTDTPNIYSFTPIYTLQATGRIGTPMQSCSRAMKQAAYGSLTGVLNYDLSSSQMALCRREFEFYRLSCPWLETYLNDSTKRDEYARYVGVSLGTWKQCLYTVLMTGHLPTNTAWQGSPVVEALESEVDSTELGATLERLRDVLKPFVTSLKQWRKIIATQAQYEGYVTNMFGLKRPIESFEKTSGMVAHILQGMEAYFIHLLTVLSYQYGFEPVGNEHDGLITLGPIPPEAIQETQRLTGLHCLELREKPFM